MVTKLLADVKEHGSGQNYLIQHSAGSGKSNSIAWLAYRLATCTTATTKKSSLRYHRDDRRVLDSQLQKTVYQFDHVEGLVQKVDKHSQQLLEAIESGKGIIITTLQKFPVIYRQIRASKRRYAIIVDEAHSSQTGNAARRSARACRYGKAAGEYAAEESRAEPRRRTMRIACWTSSPRRACTKTCPSLRLPQHQKIKRCRCSARGTQAGGINVSHLLHAAGD